MSGMLDEISDESPVLDKPSCRLLGPVALIVQGAMGLIVISTLVYKRYREHPRRPWRIWLFDVSKQILGQMFVHGVNVLISDVISRISSGNACIFYFLNILIDTTLGVAIIYFMLHALQSLLTDKMHFKGFESGVYGNPPSLKFWGRQAAVYVLSITTMKLVVIALFALWPGIFEIGDWLLSWTGDGSNFQIIFVMGLFPIFMNCLQFWLIDSIVKASTPPLTLASDSLDDSDERDREPLFRASSDDEEDAPGRPHDIENQLPHSSSTSPREPSVGKDVPDEQKSADTMTGSSAPSGTQAAMHSYPPSLSHSDSPNRSPASSRLSSKSPQRRRRSPPPPLLPRSPLQPAINSPSLSQHYLDQKPAEKLGSHLKTEVRVAGEDPNESWDLDWDNDGDDWANRVGEEDWTGRRMEERKDYVVNNHHEQSPTVDLR
ncbi:hypothetical protein PUNSTDRAFT_100938 [Punctularia strigosozonata HHB-11173 SS5]|uniref:uncharacterized protein n=1 Tax=Punctularia strigosozonata (strain HHB-11173) TaxID=741275 RepID=UPI00044183F7|nr:uncharacterized protein PUNSTDRAFT_100938 [Punctularia strigosozonata HHB-11173 SS5]EIN11002.1 hypothetical protein PUNSTDRAFT_100938 [Punctularia strigosozonata HHB-11173 SS5]